ncbi:hypothetical protein MGN01_04710 [Methylobacterium gnaphalii]|uniref:Uncharacterized protein n=1 Tax=Methylobacterium gnaphalii TaxID=1010610 RepID=A0A512JFA4_9HYPH|nr:hypothetical protein MGN01_04710 [Methylobacterium gnaphalii]GLS50843.1 hypothetical protein GCM10007885_36970 [Methylobacterium gnaphalii]
MNASAPLASPSQAPASTTTLTLAFQRWPISILPVARAVSRIRLGDLEQAAKKWKRFFAESLL